MKFIGVVVMCLGLSFGIARAADKGDAEPKKGPDMAKRFKSADADKDGAVSESEYLADMKKKQEAMAKKKGEEAEFAAKWEKQSKGISKRFKKADADQNGSLSQEEFVASLPQPKNK